MEIDEEFEVQLARVTEDGKGIAHTDEGYMLIIDICSEEDEVVKVRILYVFEATATAKKISKIKADKRQLSKRNDIIDSPYGIDDDDEEEEDDEDD